MFSSDLLLEHGGGLQVLSVYRKSDVGHVD